MGLDQQHWRERLAALARQHGVVGASLAIGYGDGDAVAASGVLNLRTGQEVTPDSVFQIGSITKTWTATVCMQLVDEGLLDLDAPVVNYLPNFRVADDALSAAVTSRNLLAHTSGIDGDFFPDTGRGDECLEKYVALMTELRASHPLGATMSYCNAGFIVLGRIIEVLRDATWDEVMRTRLFGPLGLAATGTLPEEALLWGAAVGHLTPPGMTEPVVAPQWGLSRNAGPAGLVHGQARELLTFARLHLSGGLAPDGTRVLSEASVRAMRGQQASVPDRWTLGCGIGLGWFLHDWDGVPAFGHDGGTIGQSAYLRIIPGDGTRADLSIALLTNGGETRDLYSDLFGEIVSELAGIAMPPRLEPPEQPPAVDPGKYVGRYVRESTQHEVVQLGDGLLLRTALSGMMATAMGTGRFEGPLLPLAKDAFLVTMPSVSGYLPAVFYALGDGTPYLHLAGRAAARVN